MILQHQIEELQEKGYCILKQQFEHALINTCSVAFSPILHSYLNMHEANRGTHRHFLPMPFEPPCFNPQFFFDSDILYIVKTVLGERVVADQWSCDVPVFGSEYQIIHPDYKRPLFEEYPGLQLPPYMLIISFGLTDISTENGAIEIAPGTHRMKRTEAFQAVEANEIKLQAVPLQTGDVLIRHPWALHRGTPNNTSTARPLISIRYVRQWYVDYSRETNSIPHAVWNALNPVQQNIMRFPISN